MGRAFLIVVSLLLATASLFGQSAPSGADSMANKKLPADEIQDANGRYVSGFEVLSVEEGPDGLGLYPIEILESIRSKWYPKLPELEKSIGHKPGTVVIEFEIRKDGSLRKLKTVESAGEDHMDSVGVEAISSSAPFAELPPVFRKKALRLRMHFGYAQPGSAAAAFCDGVNSGAHATSYLLHSIKEGVTPPKAIYDPDPEYSDQARREKYQSALHIAGTVDPKGNLTDLCVSEAAGEGLDEKAIEAVTTWKFEPARFEGEPVAARISVQVNFRLY